MASRYEAYETWIQKNALTGAEFRRMESCVGDYQLIRVDLVLLYAKNGRRNGPECDKCLLPIRFLNCTPSKQRGVWDFKVVYDPLLQQHCNLRLYEDDNGLVRCDSNNWNDFFYRSQSRLILSNVYVPKDQWIEGVK